MTNPLPPEAGLLSHPLGDKETVEPCAKQQQNTWLRNRVNSNFQRCQITPY